MSLEDSIDRLAAAVEKLAEYAGMPPATPTSKPRGGKKNKAPEPTAPQVQVPTPQTQGPEHPVPTFEELKVFGNELAQKLGPRAGEIFQALQKYGVERFSMLPAEHYAAYFADLQQLEASING